MDRPAKSRPKLYIINLQWTPKDEQAMLKINGKCDEVMEKVMDILKIPIPKYSRSKDPIFSHATPLYPAEEYTTSRPSLRCPFNCTSDYWFPLREGDKNCTEKITRIDDNETRKNTIFEDPGKKYLTEFCRSIPNSTTSCGMYGGKISQDDDEEKKHNGCRFITHSANREKISNKEFDHLSVLHFSVESGNEIKDCRVICKEEYGNCRANPIEIVYEGVKLRLEGNIVDSEMHHRNMFTQTPHCFTHQISLYKQLEIKSENSDRDLALEVNHVEKTSERCSCSNSISLTENSNIKMELRSFCYCWKCSAIMNCDFNFHNNKNLCTFGSVSNDGISLTKKCVSNIKCRCVAKDTLHSLNHVDHVGLYNSNKTENISFKSLNSIKNEDCDKGVSPNIHPGVNMKLLHSVKRLSHCDGAHSTKRKNTCNRLPIQKSVTSVSKDNSSLTVGIGVETEDLFRMRINSTNKSKYSRRTKCVLIKPRKKICRRTLDNKSSCEDAEEINALKCSFCSLNYGSNICLFYRPQLPYLKNTKQINSKLVTDSCKCDCPEEMETNVRSGGKDLLLSKRSLSQDNNFEESEDCCRMIVHKANKPEKILNPGWYGRGYRKLIKKKH